MRAVRLLLVLAGCAAAGYGGWLLRPELAAALPWLLAGPLLHDVLVAPLVALTGLLLGRWVVDGPRRGWIAAGLAVTGVLLLLAVPLVVRPTAPDADPWRLAALAPWLVPLWVGIAAREVWRRRPGRPPARRPVR